MTSVPVSGPSTAPVTVDDAPSEARDPWSHPALHPIRWFERRSGLRFLPGVSFPIAAWVLWRLLSLWASVSLGGDAVKTAYNYDGERYLQILHYGYVNPGAEMPNTAFFPGVSWLGWPVYQLTHSNAWTAHLVASATAIAALIAVWGVSREWVSERVARRAVVLMLLMPSSLFLWAFYSEGLFVALSAGAVWADRKQRHWLAAAFFLGLSTTRTIGVLVPLVVVLARVIRHRRIDRWCLVYAGAGLVGLVPVLWMMRAYTGDPLAFMKVQADWGRGLSWPTQTIAEGYQNLWPRPETIMVPARVARNFDLWCVLIVAVAVAFLAFSRRPRFPMEAWMLGIALIALPLCSSSLASFNRFALADWVIFPAWAALLDRLPRWAKAPAWTVVTVSLVVVSVAFLSRFSADRFVG